MVLLKACNRTKLTQFCRDNTGNDRFRHKFSRPKGSGRDGGPWVSRVRQIRGATAKDNAKPWRVVTKTV